MANLGPGAFKLQIAETGAQVEGRFDANQEALVLEALKSHRNVRLRVKGTAEFSTRDRQIKRLTKLQDVELAPSAAVPFDEAATPIWEQLAAIGKQAPVGTWESVPNDLSMRIDEIIYGHGESDR
jgi:type II secretory pathway component PulF